MRVSSSNDREIGSNTITTRYRHSSKRVIDLICNACRPIDHSFSSGQPPRFNRQLLCVAIG